MQEAATTTLYVVFSMPLAYMCSFMGKLEWNEDTSCLNEDTIDFFDQLCLLSASNILPMLLLEIQQKLVMQVLKWIAQILGWLFYSSLYPLLGADEVTG